MSCYTVAHMKHVSFYTVAHMKHVSCYTVAHMKHVSIYAVAHMKHVSCYTVAHMKHVSSLGKSTVFFKIVESTESGISSKNDSYPGGKPKFFRF